MNLTDSSDNDIVSFVDFDWGPDPDPTHSEASILATVYTSKEDLWKSRHHPGFSFVSNFYTLVVVLCGERLVRA